MAAYSVLCKHTHCRETSVLLPVTPGDSENLDSAYASVSLLNDHTQ